MHEGFGNAKKFYRKGNSVKRSAPFSELLIVNSPAFILSENSGVSLAKNGKSAKNWLKSAESRLILAKII